MDLGDDGGPKAEFFIFRVDAETSTHDRPASGVELRYIGYLFQAAVILAFGTGAEAKADFARPIILCIDNVLSFNVGNVQLNDPAIDIRNDVEQVLSVHHRSAAQSLLKIPTVDLTGDRAEKAQFALLPQHQIELRLQALDLGFQDLFVC